VTEPVAEEDAGEGSAPGEGCEAGDERLHVFFIPFSASPNVRLLIV
jgi:hypothetical protein